MKLVKISSKNQITLPAEILANLQVAPYQSVLVDQRGEEIILKLVKKSIIEQTAGSLRKYIPKEKLGISFSRVREETQKIVAQELVKKGI